jgi:CBS domain containing-hemolysin-like protein
MLAALVPLCALRVLATAAEVTIGAGPSLGRPGRLPDTILASAASAVVQVTSATIVAVLVALVWLHVGRGVIPLVLAVAVPSLLVILDLVPRGLAAEVPARRSALIGPALTAAAIALAPVLVVERAVALLIGRPGSGLRLAVLRRLGGWLAAHPGRGPLEVSEAGLIARIDRFADKTTGDAMVRLVDVCAVPDDASVADVVARVRERGFSRLPVFHEQSSNITGIVTAHDLLGALDLDRPVGSLVREPLFVPASKPLPELLGMLQAEGRDLAVVVDEYGGAVGLLTVEDVVEEIVGEIEDEYDAPRELYRRVAPGVFLVSARASVVEVNERFGWNLPQGEYETLAGLLLERLGRVPKPGDTVRAGRVRLEVTRATPRAVQEVRIVVPGLRGR